MNRIPPHASAAADLELESVLDVVRRGPGLLLAIERLAVRFAELVRADLNAAAEGQEAEQLRGCAWPGDGPCRRCLRRPGGSLRGRVAGAGGRVCADEQEADGKSEGQSQGTKSRTGRHQLTPTAVQACVIARSAALPAP